MEQYSQIITELEAELKQIAMTSESMLSMAKSSINRCRIALVKLRWIVVNQGFPDIPSEIHFFKEIKPFVSSRLLFYQAVFEVESFRSKYDSGRIKQYMNIKLDEIKLFLDKNAGSVQYYNCGFTYLDSLYFVRKREEIPVELRGSQYLMDEQFNTWQDHTFSVLRANDLLAEYLNREISQLDNPQQAGPLQQLGQWNWTGAKIDMAELIYALFFSRVINNGKITIKELTRLFFQIFNLDIEKEIYRYYTEIQQRKIDQTKFLEHLKSVLQYNIDQNI